MRQALRYDCLVHADAWSALTVRRLIRQPMPREPRGTDRRRIDDSVKANLCAPLTAHPPLSNQATRAHKPHASLEGLKAIPEYLYCMHLLGVGNENLQQVRIYACNPNRPMNLLLIYIQLHCTCQVCQAACHASEMQSQAVQGSDFDEGAKGNSRVHLLGYS